MGEGRRRTRQRGGREGGRQGEEAGERKRPKGSSLHTESPGPASLPVNEIYPCMYFY